MFGFTAKMTYAFLNSETIEILNTFQARKKPDVIYHNNDQFRALKGPF